MKTPKFVKTATAFFGMLAGAYPLTTQAIAPYEGSEPSRVTADGAPITEKEISPDEAAAEETRSAEFTASLVYCVARACAESPETLKAFVAEGYSFKGDYEIVTEAGAEKKVFYYTMEAPWGTAYSEVDADFLTKQGSTPTETGIALKRIYEEHTPEERIALDAKSIVFMFPKASYIGDTSKVDLIEVEPGTDMAQAKGLLTLDTMLKVCEASPEATKALMANGFILAEDPKAYQHISTLPNGKKVSRDIPGYTVGTKKGGITTEAGTGLYGDAVKRILDRDRSTTLEMGH